jgi:ADP-dependent NAD(P)H-hydrate dehydratase / NAD(P)H-hydrate epimerase
VKIVGSDAMARIDGLARERYGIPSLVLMENAGIKAWAAARAALWDGGLPAGPVVFAAGRGNNGGDALVMARQAVVDGCPGVSVILAGGRPPQGSETAADLAMAENLAVPCIEYPAADGRCREVLDRAAWVFDGLAGTGIRGQLRPPLSDLAALLNASPGRRIAIDVPSGVRDGFRAGEPAVRAELTLTMGLPKVCLYLPLARDLCGEITVVPVGFPPALLEDPDIPGEMLDEASWERLLRPLPATAHKGTRGHLAAFAGSPGTTGAAWLAATAAARCRVGLVSLHLDPDTWPVLAPRLQSVMAKPWDPSAEGFDASRYSALLVGPGWGCTEERARWLAVLVGTGLPGVIDADGLTLLGRAGPGSVPPLRGAWILTPHPGEFARLTGAGVEEVLADPVGRACAAARSLDAVVVLKGACTVVAAPSGRYWVFDGCNAALATGGSGDVLAGLAAGALATGMTPLDAALFGVSLHARLGRIARGSAGWFLAEDLLPLVSQTLGKAAR